MQLSTLSALNAAKRERRAIVLVTDIDSATHMAIAEGDPVPANLQPFVEPVF